MAERPRENSAVSPDRRLLVVVLAALIVAAPAVVFRTLCLGRSCERPRPPTAPVPFCSLPDTLRARIAAGYRDGRTPHVLAVTGALGVRGSTALPARDAAWPSTADGEPSPVPLVLHGTGVRPGVMVPPGTTLDAVAPTIAEIIGLDRPHPGVRSGEAVPGVASGRRPRLVVLVVWKGVGVGDLGRLRDREVLGSLMREGAGTMEADVGSLPLDPAATLATIGTGGFPRNHGITGTLLRNDEGRVVEAWGRDAPFSVIATLGDDLDELLGQEPRIGLVGTHVSDQGLIGGNWYVEGDRDDVIIMDRRPEVLVPRAERLLASGYGRDEVPDLLAVALEGSVSAMDGAVDHLVRSAGRAAGGSALLVVTATGATDRSPGGSLPASDVEGQVEELAGPVIEATALGGLFLDQSTLAETGITEDQVVRAVRAVAGSPGQAVFADTFPAIALTFARYC